MGCGKTRNSEVLRKYFGCDWVWDGWIPGESAPSGNFLILTNFTDRDALGRELPNTRIVDFRQAASFALKAGAGEQ